MHLRVLHRTSYTYRSPVLDSHNEVRLRPATDDPKRLLSYLLRVHPPRRLRHFRDDNHNYVQWFEIPEPHSELLVESSLRIQTSSQYADGGRPKGVAFSVVEAGEIMDMMRPFLTSSRYVTVDEDVWRLAIDIRDEQTDVFVTAEAIMSYIHANWQYQVNTTTSSTHMLEVMRDRRGVCQDFAHVMIGLCRSLGIPARYVSGYLYNGPSCHLRGAQASHAWCEIWLSDRGWYGLDPTNHMLVDERYIKIATGRDYDDAAPVRGSFKGTKDATAELRVTVDVEAV